MPGKDLGTKHICYKCEAKFYDLKKPEPICPKCGADQRKRPVIKPAAERRRAAAAREPVEEKVSKEVPEGELEELDDEDEDEDEAEDDADDK